MGNQKVPKLAKALKSKLEKEKGGEDKEDALTFEGTKILATDGYNPWIRTIQRAVQLRSFLERVVLETMVPKAMKKKKAQVLTIKGYNKLLQSINNPNDHFARQVIQITESY